MSVNFLECSKLYGVLHTLMFVNCRGLQALDGGGLGIERPADLTKDDDEFDAYRKRMMLAYRFRPNPLVREHTLFEYHRTLSVFCQQIILLHLVD